MTHQDPSQHFSNPSSPEERNWSVLAHIGALVASVLALGQIVVPLVIWLWKKEESDFIATHARESLNFQISMTLYFIVAGILTTILVGYLMLAILVIVEFVCVILACIAASRGDFYRYPFSLRLIQ